MLDSDRILAKLDELDSYLREIAEIKPANIAEYQAIEKKRSCEPAGRQTGAFFNSQLSVRLTYANSSSRD